MESVAHMQRILYLQGTYKNGFLKKTEYPKREPSPTQNFSMIYGITSRHIAILYFILLVHHFFFLN